MRPGFNGAVNRGPAAFADFLEYFRTATASMSETFSVKAAKRKQRPERRRTMITFIITLFWTHVVTVLLQLLTKMKIVGGNELGIVSGTGKTKGFTSI